MHRLGDIGIHTSRQTLLFIAIHCMSGHGDHRNVLPTLFQTHAPCRFQTIQHRHLDIHQHHRIGALFQLYQRFFSIARQINFIAALLQYGHDYFLIHNVVFHQKHNTGVVF